MRGEYRFEEELHRIPQTARFRATRLSDGAGVTVTELLFPPSERSMIRSEARRTERSAQRIDAGDVPQLLECVVMGGVRARTSVYLVEPADEERRVDRGQALDRQFRQRLEASLPAGSDGDIGVEAMTRLVKVVLRALIPQRSPEETSRSAHTGGRILAFVSLAGVLSIAAVFYLVLEPAQEASKDPSPSVAVESTEMPTEDEARSNGRTIADELDRSAAEIAERLIKEGQKSDDSASEPTEVDRPSAQQRRRTPEPPLPQQAQDVPSSVGPLRLGMSLETAQEAVPEERKWRRRAAGRPMPDGSHWWVQTPLLGEEIRCQVYFCDDEGLCRIYCEKHVAYAPQDYGKVRDELFSKYSERYGTHTRYFERDGTHRIWWWTHPEAELRLRTDSTPVENISGDQGHATKRIHLESAFYQQWHDEN